MFIQEIIWTDLAIDSLNKTNDFILTQWNAKISERFLDIIDNSIDILFNNPKSGIQVEGTQFRRLIVNKHTSLFYQINKSTIKILLIWDNRQNPKLFRNKLGL